MKRVGWEWRKLLTLPALWGFLALCAAGVLPHMEPDRYSWLLAGAVTILFGAELLLWRRGRRDR